MYTERVHVITLAAHVNASTVERRELFGRPALVAPAVILTEGVHNGLYYPSGALEETAYLWSGTAVTIHHPPKSARDVEVANEYVIGWLYDARASEGKLQANIWLDIERCLQLGGDAAAVLVELSSGGKLDVSTGLYANVNPQAGVWNGEEYEGIVLELLPDHLAILWQEDPACTWDDGCGVPRANAEARLNIRSRARRPDYDGTETIDWGPVDKSLRAYVDGYYRHAGRQRPDDLQITVEALPREVKAWIASKTLLGEAGAETVRDLIFFPVVNPRTNRLNRNALLAVLGGRGAQADIPRDTLESARSMARRLLDEEFGEERGEERNAVRKILRAIGLTGSGSGVYDHEGSAQECGCAPAGDTNVTEETMLAERVAAKLGLDGDAVEALAALGDEVLERMAQALEAQGDDEEGQAAGEAKVDEAGAEEPRAEQNDAKPCGCSQLGLQPEQLASILQVVNRLAAEEQQERARLLKVLSADQRVAFTREELEAMTTAQLQKLEATLRPAERPGSGFRRSEDTVVPPPVLLATDD